MFRNQPHLGGGTTAGEFWAECGMAGGGMSGFFGNCPGNSICLGGVPGALGRLPLHILFPSSVSDKLLWTEPGIRGFTEPSTGLLVGFPGLSICAGDITGVLGVLLRLRNISSILFPRVTRSPWARYAWRELNSSFRNVSFPVIRLCRFLMKKASQ